MSSSDLSVTIIAVAFIAFAAFIMWLVVWGAKRR